MDHGRGGVFGDGKLVSGKRPVCMGNCAAQQQPGLQACHTSTSPIQELTIRQASSVIRRRDHPRRCAVPASPERASCVSGP